MPKRKPLMHVSEPDYPRLEAVRQKIAIYKAKHGLRTMLEALEAILEKLG